MSFKTVFRFSDASAIEGTATDPMRTEHERKVREARLQHARRQAKWVEIPETRLVRRGPFLVDAKTDLVYVQRHGVVYEPGKAVVCYVPDNVPMTFTVNEADEIVFLDQPSDPRTWSEVVERRARRDVRRTM